MPCVRCATTCGATSRRERPRHRCGRRQNRSASCGACLPRKLALGRRAHGAPVARQSNFDAAGAWAGPAGGQDVRDIRARAPAAHHEAFCQQLFIGQHHHGSGNVQLLGQLARRGQAFGAAHDAPQNRLAKPQVDLARKRLAGRSEVVLRMTQIVDLLKDHSIPQDLPHEIFQRCKALAALICAGLSLGRARCGAAAPQPAAAERARRAA